MLIESDKSKTTSKANVRKNNEKPQSEKEMKELEHKGAKKQIEEPTLEVEKVTTIVQQQNFVTNSNDFSTLAIPPCTGNCNTVENFSKKDMNLLSFENFLTQQQKLITTFSESCSAGTRNTNLLFGTRQDLDPTNQLFSSNQNSVQVVGDNVDASLTLGKYFQSNTLNIQNSDLSNNQQHPLLPDQPFLFIQDLQQPLFRNLDHCINSLTIQHTDVVHCGLIDDDLLQLQEMLEMEKDKGKQNQLRYQIQTNTSKENTTSHYDRNSRIDQPEFHSNYYFNNIQNEELVNNVDETTFAKQNSSIVPILQRARSLKSSEHQIKDDVGLPPALYYNQKQKVIIAISEKPYNPVRSKVMDMENNKSSNDTKPHPFLLQQPCLFDKGLRDTLVQSQDFTTNTQNTSYSQLTHDLFNPNQLSQEKKPDKKQRESRDQWQQTCLHQVSPTQNINIESNANSKVIVQWNRRDKSIIGNKYDNEPERNVTNCDAQKHSQHQDLVNDVKEKVISKLQQESLNKANEILNFPVTYDPVKETCSEVHLNLDIDVASKFFWNQEQPTLTPISKIQGAQFQPVPADKQNTNNMNNFSQCDQLNHNLLQREHISDTNIDEEEPDQLPHQVKQREPQNAPQNQNINIELHYKSSATAMSHRHKESFVTTDQINSSPELRPRDLNYHKIYNLQVVKGHPQQAYIISSINYNYKKHRKSRNFCGKTLSNKGNKNKIVSFSPQRAKEGNQRRNSRNIAVLNLSRNLFQHRRKTFLQNNWQRFLNNSHHMNNVQKHPESGQLQQILPNSTKASLVRGSSQDHHGNTPQRQTLITIQNNPTHFHNDCEQCSSGSTGSSIST